jgi:hypothetical protein
MVSKYRTRRTGLPHFSRDPQDFYLLRTAINKISYKYYLSAIVSEYALQFGVSHFYQQSAKRIGVAVYVTYNIVKLRRQ